VCLISNRLKTRIALKLPLRPSGVCTPLSREVAGTHIVCMQIGRARARGREFVIIFPAGDPLVFARSVPVACGIRIREFKERARRPLSFLARLALRRHQVVALRLFGTRQKIIHSQLPFT